jgi:hypothetical protein
MRNKKWLLIQAVFPLALGACIYLLFRNTTIISSTVLLQHTESGYLPPGWVIYNLPDFLWLYSLFASLTYLWMHSSQATLRAYIFSGFICALLSEVLQKFKLLFGTFDPFDLLFYLFALVLFWLINSKLFKT